MPCFVLFGMGNHPNYGRLADRGYWEIKKGYFKKFFQFDLESLHLSGVYNK
jgi:hypothetical protein